MYRNILTMLVLLCVATLPLVAQEDDTPAEPEGPRSFAITKGSLSRDIGWIYPVVVNTRTGSESFLYDRSAAGLFTVGPGFYEVHKLDVGDEDTVFSGDVDLGITASRCGRRNQIVDDSRRDVMILNCDATISWTLDTDARMAAFIIIQIEDWSEE
ncbi:MAG: hypothetical protein J4G17_03650 [Anaerolineae bacterium]|nr:hypothetical protein [Anaerolineae bacterium]